jgi:hypothetical protein
MRINDGIRKCFDQLMIGKEYENGRKKKKKSLACIMHGALYW